MCLTKTNGGGEEKKENETEKDTHTINVCMKTQANTIIDSGDASPN
jgi:hypothetical protein